MQVFAYKLRPLLPPRDNLHAALRAAHLKIRDGDVVAVASKVVSIHEGRSLPSNSIDKQTLIKREADYWFTASKSKYRRIFTIAGGALVGSAGIDESNGNGHYILYPKDPAKSARQLRAWLKKEFKIKKLGVVIVDSTSIPLRRGAIGFALAWSGFAPLKDYRATPDLFGRPFEFEMANIADSLAAAANLAMGEGREQTPLVIVRAAPVTFTKTDKEPKGEALAVPPADDLFAPLFWTGKKWKSKKK